MSAAVTLETARIPRPCPADWERMDGDDRVRHCGICRKNVYNLSAMTRAEAEDLIASADGELCGRLYRRSDGMVMTSDCPENAAANRRWWVGFAGGIVTFTLSLVGLGRMLGLDEAPTMSQGKICVPRNAVRQMATPAPSTNHGDRNVVDRTNDAE